MPFHILPVGDADISELISIQNAAFASNPIDNAMFPTRSSDAVEAGSGPVSNVEIEDATAQKDGNAELIKEKSKEEDTSSTTEHQIAQLRKDMTTNEASRYIKCVDEDGQKIISWAKWEIYPSSRPETEWMKDTELEVEPGANKEYTEAFVRGLDDWKKKLFRGDPYCYLQILVTHPQHQRRGAASRLIQWGCDVADEKNIPVYIEAGEDGLQLYLKFRFEVVGELILDLTRFGGEGEEKIAILVRQPGGGGQNESGDEGKK